MKMKTSKFQCDGREYFLLVGGNPNHDGHRVSLWSTFDTNSPFACDYPYVYEALIGMWHPERGLYTSRHFSADVPPQLVVEAEIAKLAL